MLFLLLWETMSLECWLPLSHTSAPPVHLLFLPNWIIAWVSTVFIKLMCGVYRMLTSQLSRVHFECCAWHIFIPLSCRFRDLFSCGLLLFVCFFISRALSSLNLRVTFTWQSTISRCSMTESWPAPSPSPTMPRQRTPSSAWSHRPEKTPPSLCIHHMPSCYRSENPNTAVHHSDPLITDQIGNSHVNDRAETGLIVSLDCQYLPQLHFWELTLALRGVAGGCLPWELMTLCQLWVSRIEAVLTFK